MDRCEVRIKRSLALETLIRHSRYVVKTPDSDSEESEIGALRENKSKTSSSPSTSPDHSRNRKALRPRIGATTVSKKKLLCKFCDKPFINRQARRNHIQFAHLNQDGSDLEEGDSGQESDPDYTSGSEFEANSAYFRKRQKGPISYRNLLPKGNIFCYFCDYNPPSNRLFMFERHIWTHTRERPNPLRNSCNICGRLCSDLDALADHQETHTEKEKEGRIHKCELCPRSFRLATTLFQHAALHSSKRPYRCDECDYRARRPGDLRKHKQRLHNTVAKYKCQVKRCQKKFKVKEGYKIHMQNCHPGKEIKYFKPPAEVETHCEICDKDFDFEINYENHVKKKHPKKAPHNCRKCRVSFYKGSEYRRHLKTRKHVKRTGRGVVQRWKCEDCGSRLSRKDKLVAHKRTCEEHLTKKLMNELK